MKKCQHCGEANREGLIFCRYCGKELRQTLVVPSHYEAKGRPLLPLPPSEPELTLMIMVDKNIKPVTIPYGIKVTLGRTEPDGQKTLHVDLSPFGGTELGVSRLHASIDFTPDAPTITDLSSTNGTFLNNQRVMPNQTRILRYGDELRLAKLVVYIYT